MLTASRSGVRLAAVVMILMFGGSALAQEAAYDDPDDETSSPGHDPTAPTDSEPTPATPPPAPLPGGPAQPPEGHPASAQPRPPLGIFRTRELQLQVALGAEFFIFANEAVGNGPAFKLSSHWLRWWGPFMLGGGPSIHYSYMFENKEPRDKIHQITLNGDILIGGGIYGKFAVYAHLLLGVGAASLYDGETRTKLISFWARATAGLGAWVHVTRWLSLGALVDVGWPGTVEILATVGFHLGGSSQHAP